MIHKVDKYRVKIIITPENHAKTQRVLSLLEWSLQTFKNEISIEKSAGDILCGTHAKAIHIFNLDKYGEYTTIQNNATRYIDQMFDIQIYIMGMINDCYTNLPNE